MEEALELVDYLPLSYMSPSEEEYIAFLWDAFQTNYEAEKHQFAVLAFHLLSMTAVYCNMWQMMHYMPEEFNKAMIGFNSNRERQIKKASDPFGLTAPINEGSVFRFMRLFGCEDEVIEEFAELVKERNKVAHPNGELHIKTREDADAGIGKRLKMLAAVEAYSRPLVLSCYKRFLCQYGDPEVREYIDEGDQINEVLIRENYFCPRDIGYCLGFDIKTLATHEQYEGIQALHQALATKFGNEE